VPERFTPWRTTTFPDASTMVFPWTCRPVGAPGGVVSATDVTTLEASEYAVEEPAAFVAVTADRTRRPTSASVNPYVRAVAPEMFTHFRLLESQRCH